MLNEKTPFFRSFDTQIKNYISFEKAWTFCDQPVPHHVPIELLQVNLTKCLPHNVTLWNILSTDGLLNQNNIDYSLKLKFSCNQLNLLQTRISENKKLKSWRACWIWARTGKFDVGTSFKEKNLNYLSRTVVAGSMETNIDIWS